MKGALVTIKPSKFLVYCGAVFVLTDSWVQHFEAAGKIRLKDAETGEYELINPTTIQEDQ